MSGKGPFIVLRLIGFLLLVGLVAVGAFMAFKAGETQGISQSPAVATAISQAAENGQTAPVPLIYGYPYHFGFFPFGGMCFSIFFLFLFFGLLRFIFFRPWHHGHWHGPWGRKWEGSVPPMFDEWHKRAHGEKPTEEGDKKE